MIDIKKLITNYPECIENSDKLKSYLYDLYTDFDDRRGVQFLILVAESGFPSEINGEKEISFTQYRKYVDNMVASTGIELKNAEKAAQMWMEALSVKLGSSSADIGTIPADHIHKYNKTIVPANCRQRGFTKYWCDCGYEYNSDFTKLSTCHFIVIEQKDPTCKSDGYVKSKCSGCGKEQTEILSKKEHSWNAWTETLKPTCMSKGERTHKCVVCGQTHSESLPVLSHDFEEWHEQIHPLCESDGKAVRVCKNCKTIEEKTLFATGHQWGDWEDIPGEKKMVRFCPLCGKEPTINKSRGK